MKQNKEQKSPAETKQNPAEEDSLAIKKDKMKPGVKYRGYGMLSEWKEFYFIPENKGAHAGREKTLFESQMIKVKKTKNLIIVSANLEIQANKLDYIKQFAFAFNEFTNFIKTHEI